MATATKTRRAKQQQLKPEAIVNDALRTFSDADFPVGTVAHQGDLILIRIGGLPEGAKPRKNRQMAEGNTQGSRHILKVGDAFDCPIAGVQRAIAAVCKGAKIGDAYVGPVFQTRDGSANLVHPEHGDHCYLGDMTIAVVYQRNLDAEDRERRVQD